MAIVIAQLGTVTAAQALAWCEGGGGSLADCNADIAAQTVGGAFCDGDVVSSLDASGNRVTTCTPTGAIEAQIAAIQADCLAHCGQDRGAALNAECTPYCGPPGGMSAGAGLAVLGALAGLAALAVWSIVR